MTPKRLKKEVAGPEREQLDRHLNAFESVRSNRIKIEAMAEQLRTRAPVQPEDIEPNSTTKIGQANIDLAIASLVSELTNVDTLCFDTLESSSYPELGIGASMDRLVTDKAARLGKNDTRLGDVWATLLAAPGNPFQDFGIPRNNIPHKPIESLLG